MEITALYKYGKVTIKVQNLSEEALVLFWPEGNLTLPDGCILSIGYMSHSSTQNYRAVFNIATGMIETDTSGSIKYKHTEDMAGTRYIAHHAASDRLRQPAFFLAS